LVATMFEWSLMPLDLDEINMLLRLAKNRDKDYLYTLHRRNRNFFFRASTDPDEKTSQNGCRLCYGIIWL